MSQNETARCSGRSVEYPGGHSLTSRIPQPAPPCQLPPPAHSGYLIVLATPEATEALGRGERAQVVIGATTKPPQSLALRQPCHILRAVPVADPATARRRVDRLLQSVRVGAGAYVVSMLELRSAVLG